MRVFFFLCVLAVLVVFLSAGRVSAAGGDCSGRSCTVTATVSAEVKPAGNWRQQPRDERGRWIKAAEPTAGKSGAIAERSAGTVVKVVIKAKNLIGRIIEKQPVRTALKRLGRVACRR